MKIYKIIFVGLLFLSLPLIIRAQIYSEHADGQIPTKVKPGNFIGPVISAGSAVFTSSCNKTADMETTCPNSFNQYGSGFAAGLNFEHFFSYGTDRAANSSLMLNLMFKNFSAHSSLNYPDYSLNPEMINSPSDIQKAIYGKIESSYQSIDLNASYNYYILSKLALGVGMGLAYGLSANFRESAIINENYRDKVQFSGSFKPIRYDNSYTAVLYDGKSSIDHPLLCSFNVSVSYNIDFNSWILKPYAAYTLNFNDMGDTFETHPNDYSAGLIFQYGLGY